MMTDGGTDGRTIPKYRDAIASKNYMCEIFIRNQIRADNKPSNKMKISDNTDMVLNHWHW